MQAQLIADEATMDCQRAFVQLVQVVQQQTGEPMRFSVERLARLSLDNEQINEAFLVLRHFMYVKGWTAQGFSQRFKNGITLDGVSVALVPYAADRDKRWRVVDTVPEVTRCPDEKQDVRHLLDRIEQVTNQYGRDGADIVEWLKFALDDRLDFRASVGVLENELQSLWTRAQDLGLPVESDAGKVVDQIISEIGRLQKSAGVVRKIRNLVLDVESDERPRSLATDVISDMSDSECRV